MAEKPQEPKQKTPKGLEIPVPKRSTVMEVFKKAAGERKKKRLLRSKKLPRGTADY